MKRKGISLIEQHIEKIVLAVVGVVFLAVVAMQFLRQPNQIEVQGKQFAPGRAFEPIESKARELVAQMGEPDPQLPDPPLVQLEQAWRAALAEVGTPEVAIAQLGTYDGPGAGRIGDEPAPTGEFRIAQIQVPAPEETLAASFRNTIDPVVKIRHPELAALLPKAQPYDKAAVTVEAVFDGQHLGELLATDPDGDEPGFARVPTAWYRDNLAILAVQVQRAEGLDASGEPIGLIDLAPLPGEADLLAELADQTPSVESMGQLVEEAEYLKPQVLQPSYLRVIAGPPWRSPSELQRLAQIEGDRDSIDRLVREHSKLLDELVDKQLALEDARKASAPTRQPNRGPQRFGDQQREPARTRPTGNDDQTSSRVRALERQIEQLNDRIDQTRITLEDMGVDIDGFPIEQADQAEGDLLDDLLESPAIHAWAHDLRVEPGHVYQYRVRFVINNPLFGRAAALPPDQRELATEPVLYGAWSAWGEPVEIPLSEYYFITSASSGDRIGSSPRVGAELYQFYYGFWRKATASLEPGDVFEGQAELPDPNLLPIFDEVALAESLRSAGPRGREPFTPRTPGEIRDPRDRQPGGPGRFIAPGEPPRERAGRPSRGTDNEDEQVIPLPPDAQPGPETLDVRVLAVLLDVSEVPGSGDAKPGSRKEFQAFLSGLGDRIVVRNPARDRAAGVYRLIAKSAQDGLRQGAPEPRPERKTLEELRREREANRPELEPEPIPMDHGNPGGGGGGGGGGG